MKLNNKTYDILKNIFFFVLPAVLFLWTALYKIWGIPYGTEIAATISAVQTALGILIGISNARYNIGVKKDDSNEPANHNE